MGPFAVVVIQLSRIVNPLPGAAAHGREEHFNLLEPLSSVKLFFYFPLAFKVRNSKNIPITCRPRRPSARALKTAANYLIPIHPSRRKVVGVVIFLLCS